MKRETLILILALIFLSLPSHALLTSAVQKITERVNEVVCILLCVIWYIGGGLTALLLVLAGVKYLTSQSPAEREEARSRMIQAIAGLIIILVAVPLVNYLIQSTVIEEFSCSCGAIT